MSREILIQHIIAIWDECDHISKKHSANLAIDFWNGYLSTFPEAKASSESPAVVSTFSPMFNLSKVSAYFHEGEMVAYEGKKKDMAIAKYCGPGFLDQNEVLHSLVDDMRAMRFRKDEPPMHADESIMAVFFTSDNASRMEKAISYIMNKATPTRVHLSIVKMSKNVASGKQRTKRAGAILGEELRKRFIKIKDGGILLEVDT